MSQPIRTSDLCDAHPDTVRILAPVFRNFGGRQLFHGQAATILTFEDNSRVREAVSEPGLGRVLVIDGGGSLQRSLVGGDLASRAATNGWAGLIVNGAVRDRHELEQTPVGVLALGLIPMKTEKRGLGERDILIELGRVMVKPGDWVYADLDGVVISADRLHDI